MTRNEVFEEIKEVIIDFFDDDGIELEEDTVASDVDGWDSLAHISILLALEEHFHIHFSIDDAKNMTNIGSLVDVVCKRIR